MSNSVGPLQLLVRAQICEMLIGICQQCINHAHLVWKAQRVSSALKHPFFEVASGSILQARMEATTTPLPTISAAQSSNRYLRVSIRTDVTGAHCWNITLTIRKTTLRTFHTLLRRGDTPSHSFPVSSRLVCLPKFYPSSIRHHLYSTPQFYHTPLFPVHVRFTTPLSLCPHTIRTPPSFSSLLPQPSPLSLLSLPPHSSTPPHPWICLNVSLIEVCESLLPCLLLCLPLFVASYVCRVSCSRHPAFRCWIS